MSRPVPDEMRGLNVPQLVIPVSVWQKLLAYVRTCKYEINGFGYVSLAGNIITVTDIFITKQVVTGGSAVALDESVREMWTNVRREGRAAEVKFQWHSHVQMPAFFSGTDLDNIARWAGRAKVGSWLVSLVANQYGQFSCQLDMWNPLEISVPLVPVFELDIPAPLQQAVSRDITGNVVHRSVFGRERQVAPSTPSNSDPIWVTPETITVPAPVGAKP